MSRLHLIWRLARFSFAHFLAAGLLVLVTAYLLPLVPGLVVRQILDSLTGQAPAGWTVESLLALLVVVSAVRPLTAVAANVAEPSLHVVAGTLMRRNMLERILERPGARALPASAGEAVSRFRNDVAETNHFLTWTLDPVGQLLVFVIALVVLAQIDATMTLLVFLPLLGVFALTGLARRRITQYRQANQEAIGEVTDPSASCSARCWRSRWPGRRRGWSSTSERSTSAGDGPACATPCSRSSSPGWRRTRPTSAPACCCSAGPGRWGAGDSQSGLRPLRVLPGLADAGDEHGWPVPGPVPADGRLAPAPPGADAGSAPRAAGARRPLAPAPPHRRCASPSGREGDRLDRLEASGLTYHYPGSHSPGSGQAPRGIHGVNLVLPRARSRS